MHRCWHRDEALVELGKGFRQLEGCDGGIRWEEEEMLRDQKGVGRRRCVYETGYCGTPQQRRFAMTRLHIRQGRGGQAKEDIEEYSGPCRSTKAATSNEFGKLDWRVKICESG